MINTRGRTVNKKTVKHTLSIKKRSKRCENQLLKTCFLLNAIQKSICKYLLLL